MEIQVPSSIVSVVWLQEHLEASNLIILNATIQKAVSNNDFDTTSTQIPHARFFDLKHKFSDAFGEFPNTFPSEKQFTTEAQKLGINKDSCLVIYDEKGIYSSARVWWMFKAFGHKNVAVLDGGFPAWKYASFKVEPKKATEKIVLGNFKAYYNPKYMRFFDDIVETVKSKSHVVIDARSESRFKGLEPEPRQGLRSGNIPDSINLPYTSLLANGCLKTSTELKAIFTDIVSADNAIIFSCGSGITACILALGAEISGYENISVYDGSWTEWGSLIKE